MTRTWAINGILDDNYLGPVIEIKPGQKFSVLVKDSSSRRATTRIMGRPNRSPRTGYPSDQPEERSDRLPPRQRSARHAVFRHLHAGHADRPVFRRYGQRAEELQLDQPSPARTGDRPAPVRAAGHVDPKADYITIKPGGEYLYHFELPPEHPTGTFWYHPHRHNSVAIQAWGGLAGILFVRGLFDEELKANGVTTEIPFVVHDPHYEIVKYPEGDEPGIAKVGRFLHNQNGLTDYTYMVSGRYQPTYTLKRNQIAHIRHLTATVENLACFRITQAPDTNSPLANEGAEGENYPFYMIASDGIAFGEVVKKNLMVTGGGERHDLLVSFDQPGEYLVKSDHLGTIQFFGTGPRDQVLARFVVTDEDAGQPISQIEAMRFTPGIPTEGPPGVATIEPSEIQRRRHFVFDIDGDTCRLPYQQFRINDTDYRPDTVDFEIEQGTVEEWVMTNPTGGVHPFHVHVNAFQVKQAYSAQVPDPKLVGADVAIVQSRIDALRAIDHPNQWRDTMIIPPKGYLRVWTRLYSKRVGKTVLHCHFLAHEETAMISKFLINPKTGSG